MTSIPVVCAILRRDDLILLAQRPEGKHLALKWEFPGGKVEPGEDPQAAMIRELREELGCEVEIMAGLPRSLHAYERGVVEMIPFVCRLTDTSAEPHPHEHVALEWVTMEALMTYDLAPADWPVVEELQVWLG
jgi:8-oxo-dGTP diphosphatase